MHFAQYIVNTLSNSQGGWNKRGGGARVPELIKEDVEGGSFFWKKLVYNCNKRGVADGKNLRNQ